MYIARLFWKGVDLFVLNFHLSSKTRDTIQRWKPRPSAFPRFDTIPECDGQTDRRTEKRTDLPSAVKINRNLICCGMQFSNLSPTTVAVQNAHHTLHFCQAQNSCSYTNAVTSSTCLLITRSSATAEIGRDANVAHSLSL